MSLNNDAPPLSYAAKISPGTKVNPGRAVFIDGKAAGRVKLFLITGSIEFNFEIGPTILRELAVVDCQVISGSADVSVLA